MLDERVGVGSSPTGTTNVDFLNPFKYSAQMIYTIYWTEHTDEKSFPCSEGTDDLDKALKIAERQRKIQYSGGNVSHVTLTSENPNSVGKSGVDTVGPEYDWKKRRP